MMHMLDSSSEEHRMYRDSRVETNLNTVPLDARICTANLSSHYLQHVQMFHGRISKKLILIDHWVGRLLEAKDISCNKILKFEVVESFLHCQQ